MARLAQRHWLSGLEREARFGSTNVMIAEESCGMHKIAAQLQLTVFGHEFGVASAPTSRQGCHTYDPV
jgi:hypothetical protein